MDNNGTSENYNLENITSTAKIEYEEPFCRCCLATTAINAEDLFDMKVVAFDYQDQQTITYFNAYLEISGCCPNRLAEISCDSYMICQRCANQLELAYAFRAQCTFVMTELEQQFALKCLLLADQPSYNEADSGLSQMLDIQIKEETQDSVLVVSDDDQDELLMPMPEASTRTTPKADYRCNQCSKKFRFERNLLRHCKEAHQLVSPFKCDACNLSYRRKLTLEKHISTKHKLAGYPCNICGMTFKAESTLSFHRQVNHQGIRYQCPYCHKLYTHGPNLWSHSFSHRERRELPFKCRECSFSTANYTYFKLHLKTTHNILYDENVYGYCKASRLAIKAMTQRCKVTITTE